jgi:hypothetical protein
VGVGSVIIPETIDPPPGDDDDVASRATWDKSGWERQGGWEVNVLWPDSGLAVAVRLVG